MFLKALSVLWSTGSSGVNHEGGKPGSGACSGGGRECDWQWAHPGQPVKMELTLLHEELKVGWDWGWGAGIKMDS